MAYDEELAHRIREFLADEPDLTEKAMFGGLGFMVAGHMAVAANSEGQLMARLAAEEAEAMVDGERIVPQVMRGRTMRGWLHIEATEVPDEEVADIVRRSAAYARTLPPKQPKKTTKR